VAYQDPLAALITFADEVDVLYMLPVLSSADAVGGHGSSSSSGGGAQFSRSQSQSTSSSGSGSGTQVVDLSDDTALVSIRKLPIKSRVPVTVLWQAFFELLLRAPCRTAIYRSELVYLALFGAQRRAAATGVQFDGVLRLAENNQFVQRSMQYDTGTSSSSSSSSSSSTATGQSSSHATSPVTSGVVDPRIAAYLCKSDITESQLELESLCGLFAAPLVPFKSSPFCPIDHSSVGQV